SLGSVSKNADPEKLEKSGMALFTQPGFKIPLARGCSAWAIFKKLPETDELSKKYDLFLGQAVAAWGDERVYQNGRPDFEHAPKEMRTTQYVSGGRFFLLGEAVDVEPTAQ
ncbi:MAG: hypothetical protein E6552_10125, partial [Sutterella wadsworthensis]|nr:hypothetical protein [Sutterella wadsworthensis]